jgi:hypothetical protein
VTTEPVTYITVFDLAQVGYREGWWPAVGLVFVAVGIAIVVYGRRRGGDRKRVPRAVGWFVLVFACLWTVLVAVGTYSDYRRLARALETGQVEYVEGPVEKFVPMPFTGHALESFEVNGQRFEYSDYESSAGFNKTASHGGPIRAGRRVRVGYVDHTIVHLEVAP